MIVFFVFLVIFLLFIFPGNLVISTLVAATAGLISWWLTHFRQTRQNFGLILALQHCPLMTPRFFALLGAAVMTASVLCGCSSPPPPATPVASFMNVQASDKSFSAQLPAAWETKSHDAGATSATVEASQGDADIFIMSDTAASFMGDASRNAVKPPVVTVHEMKLDNLDADFSSPQKGPTLEMTSALGPARYTEFTAATAKSKVGAALFWGRNALTSSPLVARQAIGRRYNRHFPKSLTACRPVASNAFSNS